MNEHEQGPMENLLEGLDQHAQFLSKEDLKAELSSRGIDGDALLKQAHEIIAQHKKAERLSWMRVADENKSRLQATDRFESWLGKGELAIRAAWQEFIATTVPGQAVAFRNKTDLTTEDMARILDDNERLHLNRPKDGPPDQK
jgi:hypothetical protein